MGCLAELTGGAGLDLDLSDGVDSPRDGIRRTAKAGAAISVGPISASHATVNPLDVRVAHGKKGIKAHEGARNP